MMFPSNPLVSWGLPQVVAFVIAVSPATVDTEMPIVTGIPVIEVVKVYGKLAGSSCYGMKAPPGSSCQIQLNDIKKALGFQTEHSNNNKLFLSRDEFSSRLESLEFQWPLKPYGIDKSLTKTAVMNKGAETRVFMEELERRQMYDRRNPTGPLPTSLRPALNRQLQSEKLDPRAVDLVYNAFSSKVNKESGISSDQIDKLFQDRQEMDYYDFLKMIGPDSKRWPK